MHAVTPRAAPWQAGRSDPGARQGPSMLGTADLARLQAGVTDLRRMFGVRLCASPPRVCQCCSHQRLRPARHSHPAVRFGRSDQVGTSIALPCPPDRRGLSVSLRASRDRPPRQTLERAVRRATSSPSGTSLAGCGRQRRATHESFLAIGLRVCAPLSSRTTVVEVEPAARHCSAKQKCCRGTSTKSSARTQRQLPNRVFQLDAWHAVTPQARGLAVGVPAIPV